MRNAILAAPLILALGGCGALSSFTDSAGEARNFMDEIREKGTETAGPVLDGAAKTFDAYCANTPTLIRDWARAEINSRTEKYDASDFCIPKAE